MSKLLEAEVREVARRLRLKQRWNLIVARHAGAQQIELRLIADLSRERGLTQRLLGLHERRVGDVDEPIGERRVVIRLRDVELELRALRRELDVRGATARGGRGVLRGDAATGEEVHRPGQTELILIRRAEPDLREVDAASATDRSSTARTSRDPRPAEPPLRRPPRGTACTA